MLTAILVAVLVVAALVVAMIALAWWRQERIVFQPPRGTADAGDDDVSRLDFQAADGQPLFAYVVDPAEPGPTGIGGTMLAFHGNADLAGWLVPWARAVARQTGWRVVLAEYRGYGGLPGTPTYQGSRLDARAAYSAVCELLDADPDRLALYGHSLGSAVAAELAADVPHGAVILQSPFSSAREMARRMLLAPPMVAWPLISRVHFDSVARVSAIRSQVSVAHGDRDLIVPLRMGRQVYDAARAKGALLVVEGAGHNDVAAVAGEAYWQWLSAALHDAAAGNRVDGGSTD